MIWKKTRHSQYPGYGEPSPSAVRGRRDFTHSNPEYLHTPEVKQSHRPLQKDVRITPVGPSHARGYGIQLLRHHYNAKDLYIYQLIDILPAMSNGIHAHKRSELLNAAHELLQTRGLNAFSHRDLAEHVGIKSASVHYYFPTKQDIGIALIQRYRDDLATRLEVFNRLTTVEARIHALTQLFLETAIKGNQWCLAGALASDFSTLAPALQAEVRLFFGMVETWLAQQAQAVLKPGDDNTALDTIAQQRGVLAFALLEGVLLSARVHAAPEQVSLAGQAIIALFQIKQP